MYFLIKLVLTVTYPQLTLHHVYHSVPFNWIIFQGHPLDRVFRRYSLVHGCLPIYNARSAACIRLLGWTLADTGESLCNENWRPPMFLHQKSYGVTLRLHQLLTMSPASVFFHAFLPHRIQLPSVDIPRVLLTCNIKNPLIDQFAKLQRCHYFSLTLVAAGVVDELLKGRISQPASFGLRFRAFG